MSVQAAVSPSFEQVHVLQSCRNTEPGRQLNMFLAKQNSKQLVITYIFNMDENNELCKRKENNSYHWQR